MKPKEYVDKYKLNNVHPDPCLNEFVRDLTADFKALIELHQQVAWNFNKFRVCVKDIRLKFDSISRRSTHSSINEKLWNYFYASVVGPIKDEMFPELKNAPKREKESKATTDSKAAIAASNARG
jgi:hypothetical protein